jgi:chromosome partitioning protein
MAARVLAFLNFKGGVGKTTNTVNIGNIMAMHGELAGRRVLLIDLDPQSNTTLWLINRDGYNAAGASQQTIYHLFKCFENRGKPDLRPLIQTVSQNLNTGGVLDLVPANFNLLELEERPALGFTVKQADAVLAKALKEVKEDYDYILLDCPPAWSLFTRNALRAADFILVPYTPDYLALEGIKWISQLLRTYSRETAPARVAKLAGVIVNRYQNYQPIHAALAELREVLEMFSQLQNVEVQIFEPMIRNSSAVTDANNVQKPLLEESPHLPVTKDFIELTQNLVHFFNQFPTPDL